MEVPGASVQAVISRLEQQRDVARADVNRLKEERDALRQRLQLATEIQVTEHARLEKTAMECGERMHHLETDRRELLVAQGVRKATISCLEEQCDTLSKQLRTAQSELENLRELYNQMRVRLDHSDRSIAKTGGDFLQATTELASAQQRIRDLEKDRMSLDKQVASLKNENTLLRGSLTQVEQERQCLLMNIDVLTENVSTLEQDLRAKEYRILSAEETAIHLQTKIETSISEYTALEKKLRDSQQALHHLKPQLDASERSRTSAERETSHLKNEVTTISQNLATARKVVETLRQNFDNLSLEKEDLARMLGRSNEEKNEMLEQFRKIKTEARTLEESNKKLENEMQTARTEQKECEVRVEGMLQEVKSREATARGLEAQISELREQLLRADSNLAKASEQISKSEAQKDKLSKQLVDLGAIRHQQQLEIDRLVAERDSPQIQMKNDRARVESLERAVQNAKQEADHEKATKINLQQEISKLKQIVSELNEKLLKESYEVRKYSRQVADLSRELADKRREENQQATQAVNTTGTAASVSPKTKYVGVLTPATKWDISSIVRSPVQYPVSTIPRQEEWAPQKVTYPMPSHQPWAAGATEPTVQQHLTVPAGFKRVHSTFTSSGPSVASWHANYSVVRRGGTETPATSSKHYASNSISSVEEKK